MRLRYVFPNVILISGTELHSCGIRKEFPYNENVSNIYNVYYIVYRIRNRRVNR